MTLSNEIISKILPEREAPWSPDSPLENEKFASFRNTDRYGDFGDLRQRSYAWQKALTRLLRENSDWATDSFTARGSEDKNFEFAVGFVDFDASLKSSELAYEVTKDTGYFFGAVVFDKLHSSGKPFRLELNAGQIDERFTNIPVVYLNVAEIADSPPTLTNATVGSWAAERGDGIVDDIITAKHAVSGLAINQNVSFSGGASGRLVAFCPSSVDAALVESPVMPKNAPPLLTVDQEPVIGESVEFVGDVSGYKSGKITKTWVFPDDLSEYDPQRVYLDFRGRPGDSGSMVKNAKTGDAVGIYVGKKKGKTSFYGQAQYLYQAAEHLNVDLYE